MALLLLGPLLAVATEPCSLFVSPKPSQPTNLKRCFTFSLDLASSCGTLSHGLQFPLRLCATVPTRLRARRAGPTRQALPISQCCVVYVPHRLYSSSCPLSWESRAANLRQRTSQCFRAHASRCRLPKMSRALWPTCTVASPGLAAQARLASTAPRGATL